MKILAAFLVLVVLALAACGFITLASITADDSLAKQGVFFGVGLIPAFVVVAVNPAFWMRKGVLASIAVLIPLALLSVHIPFIGREVKGALRWISIGGLTIQPSEAAKVAFIVLLAWWMQGPARKHADHMHRVFIPVIAMLVVAACLYLQRDYGSIMMLAAVAGPVMLFGGAKIHHIIPYGLAGVAAIAVLIASNTERRERVSSWFNPAAASSDDRYQIHQSLNALKEGRAFGRGYGNSVYKSKYLPERHTDFVFSMIGEEWGFAGAMFCLSLFIVFTLMGFYIAFHAPDLFTALAAFGMTLHICLAALVNIAMISDCIPTKGLALPFISYGGSNLVCSTAAAAFLISICWRCGRRHAPAQEEAREGGLLPV